jgi:hypothetical protein
MAEVEVTPGMLFGGWAVEKVWTFPRGTDPTRPCPHCYGRVDHTRKVLPAWTLEKSRDPDWETKYGVDETTYTWTCPRVLVATSEANDESAVCLDCFLGWPW